MRALILLLLLLVATSAAWSQEPIVMTGRLVDLDHAPVVGATIEADQANNPAISDREGRFELRVVTRTPFLFEVKTATGRVRTFDAYPRRGADLGDLLICPGGSVVGRLIDGEGDQIVAGFVVRLASSTTDDENDEFTHPFHVVEGGIDPATGEFRFLDVPPGLYILTATEEEDPFPFHGKDLLVEPGRELYLEYGVTPPSVLEVSLVCADPNLLVLGLPSLVAVVEGGGGVHALPNLGVYRFENLPPGTVRFFLPGAELENPDRRHACDAGRVVVRWRPAKVLEFTALTPEGDPVPALVRMHDPRSGFQPTAVQGGIQGEWDPRKGPLRVASFLERSGADLFLTPDGYLTHHEFLGVLEEGVQRREVVFHKPERREVTFQSGAGGLPLAGAVVRIQSRSMSARWDQSIKQLSGDGRLLIDVAANTNTDLQVDWGHGIVENYTYHHDGTSDGALRAPDVGWLRGTVQLPAGLDPTQYVVRTDAATFGTRGGRQLRCRTPPRREDRALPLARRGVRVVPAHQRGRGTERAPHDRPRGQLPSLHRRGPARSRWAAPGKPQAPRAATHRGAHPARRW
ncbi:MAG: hypothetical protein O2816_11105 [Planctomycetota bacterium]|nr:hypothetical protein [Planctomycetota bacterium]